MAQAFQLTVDSKGIGRLIFDLPNEKVNTFSLPILEELEKLIDDIAKRQDIKVLVISGKEDSFVAGANLHSFEEIFKKPQDLMPIIEAGHRTFDKLSKLPFPTIAYIHGICLGGGTEFALSCTYRIASDSPKTSVGLPETQIGIFPGWGGTQRLPRLVGLIEGLNMILSGKPVKGQKAFKLHLADALIANEFKEEKIAEFVEKIQTKEGKKSVLSKRKLHGLTHWLLEANPIGRTFVYYKVKKDVLSKTKGHYPAPLVALDVVKNSYSLPLEKGLKVERETMYEKMPVIVGIAQNLIRLFFIQEALKKDTGAPEGVKPSPITSTGVLGGGVMGSGIAWLLTSKDYPVRLRDIDYASIGKAYGAVQELYDQQVKKKRMKASEASLKFQHLSCTTDLTGFQHVDLVVEAAVENLELKNKLFAEIEARVPDKAVIASNTSSLGITTMAKSLKHPERFVGMHFFNPVPRMPLVEVVQGQQTSPQTVATAVDFCKKLGKTPMVVGDCAGFLVNRIFLLGANEATRLLEEGVPHERLDKMMLNFGYPMAPFILADEVGNDVSYKVSQVLEEAYGPRMKCVNLIKTMYERKLFGKKVGKGFYIWKGKASTFNPEVLELIGSKKVKYADEEMRDRVILLMVNEAARCLEEKIIQRVDYLDMALIMGTGFPPFRGGLLYYADGLGITYVVDQLKRFEQKYGERFTPCQKLLDMKAGNKMFYS